MKSKSRFFLKLGFIINCLTAFYAQSQTTNNPLVAQSNCSNCKIISINIESDKTTVVLEYEKTQPDRIQSWISISKYTVLSDFYNDRNSYPIISLGNEQLDTKYSTKGKKGEKYYFTLVFPKLATGIEKVNIKELTPNGSGFEWQGISIINPDNSPKTNWTEVSLKKDWQDNGNDNIEGIYENTIKQANSPKYRVALKKIGNGYSIIYLGGAEDDILGRWNEGAIKGSLVNTAKANFYKAIWLMNDKTANENLYITFDEGLMKIIWTNGAPEQIYLKLFPTTNSSSKKFSSSGTGFALTSDGLVVTNHHVIEGANSITIKGINGNFSISFRAKVVISDKNNDLAILKIIDDNFNLMTKIPYTIKSFTSDVGENIFVLGYPLRATMGEEIKLTNGIISSKTGFQGDITSYQISAPIQPGNSGGPLFDNAGNLIGIINAKLKGGENVSYAIKISYLKNLIDNLPITPVLNGKNSMALLSLSEKVKILNKYVYIIEANKD